MSVPKHVRVRRNEVEKGKLDYLEDELKQSPRLKHVETDIEDFEDATSQNFESTMIKQFQQITEKERVDQT